MQSRLNSTWTAYLKLGLTMVLWGVAWPVGGIVAENLPAISIATIRYTIVVVVFLSLLRFSEGSITIPRNWMRTMAVLGLLSVTLYQAFFLFSVHYANSGDDSLVIGLSPLMIAVLASFIVKEPLGWRKVLGLFSGLAGVVLIAELSPNNAVPNRILGMSLVVGGVVVYAFYTVFLRRFITSQSTPKNGAKPSSLAIITWVSLFGFLFLIPFSIPEHPWTYTWGFTSWLAILYLALFSTVVGYLFFVQGVSEIGASRASIFNNLVPVFGVLSSVPLQGTQLNGWYPVSFALIFAGVYLVNRRT